MKKILVSMVAVLLLGMSTQAQNGTILNNYELDWSWVDGPNGSVNYAWNDVCCGGTVYMINRCQYNLPHNPISIGNLVSTGYYWIRAQNSSGTWVTIASIPAANWVGGQVISLTVNQCDLMGGNSNTYIINWDVKYVQNNGTEVSPNDGIHSMSHGYYLKVRNVPLVVTASQPTVCMGNSVQLNATGGQNYIWSPTNGLNSSTIANPVFTPPSNGSYIFGVNATSTFTKHGANLSQPNTFTCEASEQVTVNVVNPVSVDLGDYYRILCSQDEFPTELNASTSGVTNYLWEFIDNGVTTTVQNGPNAILQATQEGKYCVTVTDQNGCTSTDCMEVIVYGVDADIQANSTILCGNTPNPITLTAIPLQYFGIYTYLWSTGETTETIDVTTPGTYTVEVTNIFGCVDEATIIITEMNFDVEDINYCFEDCNFTFTPNVSASAGTTLSYHWGFGNGIISTDVNPVIHFQHYGVNNVTLTITATTGSETCEYINTISVFNNCPDERCTNPEPSFKTTGLLLYIDGSVNYLFEDNSINLGGVIVNSLWTVKQGNTTIATYTTPSFTHVLAPGSYEVCFTATVMQPNGVQCVGTYCKIISVRERFIEEKFEGKGMKIFPNPSEGMFAVEIETIMEGKDNMQVNVYNLQGKTVYSSTEKGVNNFNIDLRNEPTGLYELVVISADKKFTEKLTIKK